MLNLPSKSNHGIEMTVLRDFVSHAKLSSYYGILPEKRYHITFFIICHTTLYSLHIKMFSFLHHLPDLVL